MAFAPIGFGSLGWIRDFDADEDTMRSRIQTRDGVAENTLFRNQETSIRADGSDFRHHLEFGILPGVRQFQVLGVEVGANFRRACGDLSQAAVAEKIRELGIVIESASPCIRSLQQTVDLAAENRGGAFDARFPAALHSAGNQPKNAHHGESENTKGQNDFHKSEPLFSEGVFFLKKKPPFPKEQKWMIFIHLGLSTNTLPVIRRTATSFWM